MPQKTKKRKTIKRTVKKPVKKKIKRATKKAVKKIVKKKRPKKIIRRIVKKQVRRKKKPNVINIPRRRIKRKKAVNKGLPRYTLNPQFQLIKELENLILKSSPDDLKIMTNKLSSLGRVKLAIVTGIFLNKENQEISTDLFIVGDDLDKNKMRSFVRSVEAEVGKEISYVSMEKDEFLYRYGMFDRFIRVLFESPHEKLINKLGI